MSTYAEIAVTTNFSFLRGASHPHEFAQEAAALSHCAIGIADRNTLAGAVRLYTALEEMEGPKPKLLVGCRLVFVDGTPDILAYPEDRVAYGRLCRLLSAGKLRAPKGECVLTIEDLLKWQEGLLLVVMPPHPGRTMRGGAPFARFWNEDLANTTDGPGAVPRETFSSNIRTMPGEFHFLLERLSKVAPNRVWLGAFMPYRGDDRRRLKALAHIAREASVPLIATNDVLYHARERRPLQDVLTCIREHVTLTEAGRRLEANAERHLKPPKEMARLFADIPEAVAETACFANRIRFSLDELRYNYPDEPVPAGKSPQEHLEDLSWKGAKARYPHGLPEKVQETLQKELKLIAHLDIAPYFLTVYDIVSFARSEGILCQGRGSAANSAVCYILGITAVDPMEIDLLFERFVSEERREPPDIDVDFEHERREEVIQYVYRRYGRHRAALTATLIRYRSRSAIREVGKVFGLTEDVTAALAGSVWGSRSHEVKARDVHQSRFDPANPLIARAVEMANQLIGFPRHLSQHVGGFVLTRDRLDEIVPVGPATMEDRYFIEWDKDDIDALGIMKVDVLALGMLTCIRKAFDLIARHEGKRYTLAEIPREDPAVYDMLCEGDAIGVFQVESRAQMNMLPRLRPRKFYDLVIEVAIVRPGPIQGNMVHPYLKRRKDPRLIVFPAPSPAHGPRDELHQVLGKTCGVPLFQEQAMKLAIVAARFTPAESNQLRRAMATFRNVGTISKFESKMVEGMVARGYAREFAQNCFNQIKGFGSYGFPESHAASFAHLVYVSAWIKKHHPAAFTCALLNAQPMGFYAPAELVRDARDHGVEVRPADVNFSAWDNTLEARENGASALRLGFRQVQSFREDWCDTLIAARGNGYGDMDHLARLAGLPKRALIVLAEADCFQSRGLSRRDTLWAVRRLTQSAPLPLFAARNVEDLASEEVEPLPPMPLAEHVLADYQMTRLSLKAHLMQFLRDLFGAEGVRSCAQIATAHNGMKAACAGVVLTRQMPGGGGVVFITLSDETGIANVVVWPSLVQTYRREIMGARVMLVQGRVQRSPEGIIHLVAERIIDRTSELARLSQDVPDVTSPMIHRHPRNVTVVPKSRDFH